MFESVSRDETLPRASVRDDVDNRLHPTIMSPHPFDAIALGKLVYNSLNLWEFGAIIGCDREYCLARRSRCPERAPRQSGCVRNWGFDTSPPAIFFGPIGRLICRKCQVPFHRRFSPFVSCPTGECESGEYLYQRDDDRPATVRKRLETYHELTAPLVDYYRGKGLLCEVDGEGTVAQVSARVLQAIDRIRLGVAG